MASMTHLAAVKRPDMVYTLANGCPNFFTVKFIADVLISWDDLGSTSYGSR